MAKRTKLPAFEEALAELEQVVDRLERGELPLEESLAAFERGMGLVRSLTERLAEIEQRVEVLLDAHGPGAAAPAGGDDLAVRDDDD